MARPAIEKMRLVIKLAISRAEQNLRKTADRDMDLLIQQVTQQIIRRLHHNGELHIPHGSRELAQQGGDFRIRVGHGIVHQPDDEVRAYMRAQGAGAQIETIDRRE